MMKRFDEFVQLSFYFKHYELYRKFLDMNTRHREALVNMDEAFDLGAVSQGSREEELKKYNTILQNLDSNTKALETQFQGFDFSEARLLEAHSDYELLSYEFLMSVFESFIRDKSFDDRHGFVSYVYAAERVIKRFFIRKFYVFENFNKVCVKIIDTLLDKHCDSQHPLKNFNLQPSKDMNV